jgi:hypothetical protein
MGQYQFRSNFTKSIIYSAKRKLTYLADEHNFCLASNHGSMVTGLLYMLYKWIDAFAAKAEITLDTSKATL